MIIPNIFTGNSRFENSKFKETPSPQKRFYTKGTIRGKRISRLAKIPPLYHNRLRSRLN